MPGSGGQRALWWREKGYGAPPQDFLSWIEWACGIAKCPLTAGPGHYGDPLALGPIWWRRYGVGQLPGRFTDTRGADMMMPMNAPATPEIENEPARNDEGTVRKGNYYFYRVLRPPAAAQENERKPRASLPISLLTPPTPLLPTLLLGPLLFRLLGRNEI